MQRKLLTTAGVTLAVAALFRWQFRRLFSKQPAYFLEHVHLPIEIRRYEPMLVIETDAGVERLRRYLREAKLRIRTPMLFSYNFGKPIVRLILPASAAPPEPRDAHVHLRQLPARRIAALRYSGKRFSHQRALLDAVADAQLVPLGPLTFAAYDALTTLPPLRRNELWVDVSAATLP